MRARHAPLCGVGCGVCVCCVWVGGGGGHTQSVVSLLSRFLEEERSELSTDDPEIDTLILLDRAVDMVTPLVLPLTYEALVDHILGIEAGTLHAGMRRAARAVGGPSWTGTAGRAGTVAMAGAVGWPGTVA